MTPIAHAIDCYAPLTQFRVNTLKQNHITAVCRYIGYTTHQWSKALRIEEVKMLHSNQIAIVLNWEGNPTHPSYFTYQQGLKDAREALSELAYLGVPKNEEIGVMFSVDFDAQPTDMKRIEDYFHGIYDAFHNTGYEYGIYGSYDVLEYMSRSKYAPRYYWQTVAWSNGRVFVHDHVFQAQCDAQKFDMSVDIDEIYTNPGWWQPQPKKTIVQKIKHFLSPKGAKAV